MKVSVIGAAGGIGQSLSMLLKMKLMAGSSISLFDLSKATPGIAEDLSHIPTDVDVKGYCGNDLDLALVGSDVVLLAAGIARAPGMDRADLFQVNAKIVKEIVECICGVCPTACIGIITNPVNTMVPVAAEVLKKNHVYDPDKLFGVTTLDQTRSISFLGRKFRTSFVPVIGGHSSSTILPLFSQIEGSPLSSNEVSYFTDQVRNAGTKVVNAKDGNGSATLSMAYAACEFCLSVVRALSGEKGIRVYAYVASNDSEAPFFTRPVELGLWGIEKLLPFGKLSSFEKRQLNRIVPTLLEDIRVGVDFIDQRAA